MEATVDQYFEMVEKLIVRFNLIDHGKIQLQNYRTNIVGTTKILLLKCLKGCLLHSKRYQNLNDTVLHILTLWFFEYHQSSQFCSEFFALFEVICTRAS